MANELRKCKYGSLCFRKNDDHRKEFWHPGDVPVPKSSDALEYAHESSSKDEGSKPVSFPPCLSSPTSTHLVDENTGDGVEGEWELDSYNELKELESDEVDNKATTSTDAQPVIALSSKNVNVVVLLLLIGVPGSGKSTFCSKLMSSAAQPWTRICQDIIAVGKRGTKKQCLRHAEHALAIKHSVVIDRCNIDKAQRLEFLQLAANVGVQAHAVVLNLPASVCIQRASKRLGHEGGLHAGNAGPIINRVFRSRQLPSLTEGFSRITFCRTDIDVEKTVKQYRELCPAKPLESGLFGAAVSNSRNAGPSLNEKGSNQNNVNQGTGIQKQLVEGRIQKLPQAEVGRGESGHMQVSLSANRCEGSNAGECLSSADGEDQGPRTLSFPSISTSDFQFDHERASNVLLEAVSEFLLRSENSKLRLVLVDLTSDSHILLLVRRKAAERGLDPLRFLTFVGDITKLRSARGPACNIIANAANWRLKAGGGGVNAAIYKAAGPELEQATKEITQTLKPGTSVVVKLPASSPLHIQEGVTHIIHVLGPNMNAQRPNCLSGDYTEGCRLLHCAYASLFQNFSSAVQLNPIPNLSNQNCVDVVDINKKPTKNAFAVLMQASKRKGDGKDFNPRRDKSRVTEDIAAGEGRSANFMSSFQKSGSTHYSGPEKPNLQHQPSAGPCEMPLGGKIISVALNKENDEVKHGGLGPDVNTHKGGVNKERRWDSWALALYKIALHPEQHKDAVLQVTDDAVVIRDFYPKAKRHVLVVTRRPGLDSLEDLQRDHIPVLRHMHSLGETWAASFIKEDPTLSFRLGYHSVPSMRQLHLHVVSQDFDSPSLKKKKHWNSFTTPFFCDSLNVVDELERSGQVKINVKEAEKFEDMELRCHRCCSAHPNLARLKHHISTCKRHLANVSSSLIISQDSLII